jgi:hypothetical protein
MHLPEQGLQERRFATARGPHDEVERALLEHDFVLDAQPERHARRGERAIRLLVPRKGRLRDAEVVLMVSRGVGDHRVLSVTVQELSLAEQEVQPDVSKRKIATDVVQEFLETVDGNLGCKVVRMRFNTNVLLKYLG